MDIGMAGKKTVEEMDIYKEIILISAETKEKKSTEVEDAVQAVITSILEDTRRINI